MKSEKYFPFEEYPKYNGTKIWIPYGYQRSVTNKMYRRYPNTERQYSEYIIQNVDLDKSEKFDKNFKSDELGIICDLISNDASTCTPRIYLTHEQIGTFVRNEEKAMLADFDKNN